MSESNNVLAIENELKKLEDSGEIVVTSPNVSRIAKEIATAVGFEGMDILSEIETRAVINSINCLLHGVVVDDADFQTIIGIDKDVAGEVLEKLKKRL